MKFFLSFDACPTLKSRGVFLDISKAFDKVWHEGLIHKLELSDIDGKLLCLIKSFLSRKFQRVVLNDQNSDWLPVQVGVP